MKNLFLSLCSFLAFGQIAQAAVTCADFQNERTQIQVLRQGNFLNESNWKSFDVISSMDRRRCGTAVPQELIKVKGELFWRMVSAEDECDGGNGYGAIYSYDLKTPIAHIFDGSVSCKADWKGDELASNHVCDMKAQAAAQAKMKDFGLEMNDLGSTLEIRTPYLYSTITVTGTLTNRDGKEASVTVMTNLSDCSIGGVSISDIQL